MRVQPLFLIVEKAINAIKFYTFWAVALKENEFFTWWLSRAFLATL
jgi:hypothetical protein